MSGWGNIYIEKVQNSICTEIIQAIKQAYTCCICEKGQEDYNKSTSESSPKELKVNQTWTKPDLNLT